MNARRRLLIVLASAFLLVGAAPRQDKGDDGSAGQGQDKSEKKDQAKGDSAKGKDIFAANCQMCHNADSDQANIGPGLKNLFNWPPHKLSDGTEHKEHTVAIIRKQIVEGGGTMPPVGASFSEQELQDLIAYLQTL